MFGHPNLSQAIFNANPNPNRKRYTVTLNKILKTQRIKTNESKKYKSIFSAFTKHKFIIHVHHSKCIGCFDSASNIE